MPGQVGCVHDQKKKNFITPTVGKFAKREKCNEKLLLLLLLCYTCTYITSAWASDVSSKHLETESQCLTSSLPPCSRFKNLDCLYLFASAHTRRQHTCLLHLLHCSTIRLCMSVPQNSDTEYFFSLRDFWFQPFIFSTTAE